MIWNVHFVEDGWWDIDKLRDALTDELVQKVIGTPIGLRHSNSSTCCKWDVYC